MHGAPNLIQTAGQGIRAEHVRDMVVTELDEYDSRFIAAASELESVVSDCVHIVPGLPATTWGELLVKARLLAMICRDNGRDSRGMIAKLSASILADLNSTRFSKKSGGAVTRGATRG